MSKLARLAWPIIWICISVASFISALVIPYMEGRSNEWWTVPPFLPVDIFPFIALFVCSIALLLFWIRSFSIKRDSASLGMMFLLGVLLLGINIVLRSPYLFQRGFSRYAETVMTADEWRNISRHAQERLQPEGQLPGPDKNLWDEKEHRALWTELCSATSIQKLDPSLMIFVRPEETVIEWGGALEGHRGVIIFTDKRENDHRSSFSQDTFIAHDIAVYISPD
jgi:hypothetical protein